MALLVVTIEKIEELKKHSILQQDPDDILDQVAPLITAELHLHQRRGGHERDEARAPEAEGKIYEHIDLMKRGTLHELEVIAIMASYNLDMLEAYEGETDLSLETQEPIARALKVSKKADANKKVASISEGGSGRGGRGNSRGQRSGFNNRSYGGIGYDRGGYDRYCADRDDRGYDRGYNPGYHNRGYDRGNDRGYERSRGGDGGRGGGKGVDVCHNSRDISHYAYKCTGPKR